MAKKPVFTGDAIIFKPVAISQFLKLDVIATNPVIDMC